ncbi:PEGA domain-containing protein [candidate division KSB1 bacterium]|nr:PEGA domain-containing protein [candidate division KSB1 bacterium]
MRRIVVFLLGVLITIAIGCSKAPVDTDNHNDNLDENEWGSVLVTAVDVNGVAIERVHIYLDGNFLGFTPLSVDTIAYGIHTLRAQKEGFEIYSESMTVDNHLLIQKEIVMRRAPLNTGQLLITVNVDSVETTVTDNANLILEQTFDQEIYLTLEAGGYFIRCEKVGYELVLKAVMVRTDSVTTENIKMQPQSQLSLPQVALSVPGSGYVNQPVLISWESFNATQVDIDYVENPGLNGKREVRFQSPGYHYIKAIAHNSVGNATATDSILIEELPNEVPEISLSVTPDRIYVNQVATIKWNSKNATEVAVDYVTNPGLSGQWQERFYQSGEVVVRAFAYGPGGVVEARDTLHVEERTTPAPTIEIDIELSNVEVNQPVAFSWSSTDAREVAVDFVENPGLSGQHEMTFSTPGTKIIRAHAYGVGGEAHDADTLIVRQPLMLNPTVQVHVSPNQVTVNEEVIIAWTSEHASQVDVDFVTNPGLSGQWKTRFAQAGEYIIHAKAYGNNTVAVAADTLVVSSEEPPKLEFEVSPGTVNFGHAANLSWRSDGVRVVIDQGVGTRGPIGNEEYLAKQPGMKYFTAIAYGRNGLTTVKRDSVMFREVDNPILPVISLAVMDSVRVGEPAMVEWRSWKADRVDVDYIPGAGLNGKSEIVFNSPGLREITAFAFNEYGQSSITDTIIVVADPVEPQIESIILPTTARVCAFHQSIPRSVYNAASAEIEMAGYYRIVAGTWYNSGDSQKNESYYLTVTNSHGETTPQNPNAGVYKVVADEPGPPHASERDAGIFYLPEGTNSINVMHYYLIADQYPQFVVDGPITSYESVYLIYFKLEFVHE